MASPSRRCSSTTTVRRTRARTTSWPVRPASAVAKADVTLADGQVLAVTLHVVAGIAGANATAATGGGTGVVPDPYGQGVVAAPAATPAADAGASWMAFEFGARLAFGLPLGSAIGGNGNDLNHFTSNQFAPLWLDAGVRLASHWYVGTYLSFGLASISNQVAQGQCNQPGFGCSGNDTRFGIDAAYHVLPDGFVDPWFGVGFGYEWFSFTETADAAHSGAGMPVTQSSGVDGWELLNLQGGVDFRLLNGALGIGPFLTLALTQYDHQSTPTDSNGGTTGSSIQTQALHEWVLFGARGTYDLKF